MTQLLLPFLVTASFLLVGGRRALEREQALLTENSSVSHSSLCRIKATRVLAMRHAHSVANHLMETDRMKYLSVNWLDDSSKDVAVRLRDAALTQHGIETSMAKGREFKRADVASDPGVVLLVVSPMLRTILTASLVFSYLMDKEVKPCGYQGIQVVLEPAAREVGFEPHDWVENLGRKSSEAFADAELILRQAGAEDSALKLMNALKSIGANLRDDWWFTPTTPDNLPKRTIYTGMAKRREVLREAVKAHVAGIGQHVSRVIIVGHWGTLLMLKADGTSAKNLQLIEVDDFLGDGNRGVTLPDPHA